MKKTIRRFITIYILFLITQTSKAEILFEGYSKVMSGGVHVGYAVQRYEFDPKSKKFTAISLVKTGALGSDVTESIKATADENLKPISYSYTSLVGKKTKTIDATFQSGKMKAIVKEDGKSKTLTTDLSADGCDGKGKDTDIFLSQFLTYKILKKGLQVDSKFCYHAIAEEDAQIYKGQAIVDKQVIVNQVKAYQILNKYSDSTFVANVSERGEVLSVNNPKQSISTELMAKPSDATGSFGVGASLMKSLFGDVPQGTSNIVSKALLASSLKPAVDEPKKSGVPGGQGIMIKAAPPVEKAMPPSSEIKDK